MRRFRFIMKAGFPLFCGLAISAAICGPAVAAVSFSTEIRPILSDKCFQCHGPDSQAREADLRFDLRESAVADLGGYSAIVPGQPDESTMIQRIVHEDPYERMPPRDTHKRIRPRELELLRQWIVEGAPYEQHWSYNRVTEPTVPADPSGWARNEIDAFVIERLRREGLAPSPVANPYVLLRRLTLDLTGLPPTPEQIARFADGKEALDVESVARHLLDSPSYGEHMAWAWLDAARYADSDGYESDPLRSMWPWRDWVVQALNNNLPFDQFITEQLAGDLLPDSTLNQKLATGFNRNHRLNNEGGILPEEWIVEYVCDRAETTATVFMGLTWGCARCHDHKFDPITQRDYYRLFAFFNNIDEKGAARGTSAPPSMEIPALDQLDEYELLRAKWQPLRKQLDSLSQEREFAMAHDAWLRKMKTDRTLQKKLPGKLGTTPYDKWTNPLKDEAREFFLVQRYVPTELRDEYVPLDRRITKLIRSGARVMIMSEGPTPKPAFVLGRGSYDQPGEQVSAATPGFLPGMDPELPRNRLGLARWLTSREHPLTARVAVNRVWERFFGVGLVKTQEDFGSQGQPPSHPKLLDYLAMRFMRTDWDLKALQLYIVSSATYQQSSTISDSLFTRDPENRLLARGPRHRLAAAVIRDQALAVSGLLSPHRGGPAVKPYQPPGLWEEIIKGRVKYVPDKGEKLYRRSLYTLWRRAVKPPLMELLDANLRDTCSVTTRRTNSPLQALLLLNDVTFVEAARQLAERIIREGGPDDENRIKFAMRLVTSRNATQKEIDLLRADLAEQRTQFQARPDAAVEVSTVGQSSADEQIDAVELATFTALARVLLNLDETLTKN